MEPKPELATAKRSREDMSFNSLIEGVEPVIIGALRKRGKDSYNFPMDGKN